MDLLEAKQILNENGFLLEDAATKSLVAKFWAIKKSGGRLLSDIDIFDIYREIEEGKKSMAYKLTFKDETRTLSDDEVMEVFNKIIVDVESKLNAKVRSN